MIKIDVEGAELEVLQGAYQVILQDRPLIVCEVLFRDETALPEGQAERNAAIMRLLNELDYVALQLIKTPDLKSISNVIKVTEFSNEVWTHENKDLCDYLFIPKEDENLVRSKLF
jgi:hypothetical protein